MKATPLLSSRALYSREIEFRRQVLGPEQPDTSISASNLFPTLQDLGERNEARAVLERDLLWLLGRNPDTVGTDQRDIRQMVAGFDDTKRSPGKT